MWASGKAAQAMLANGYATPTKVEDLTNNSMPTIYTTKTLDITI